MDNKEIKNLIKLFGDSTVSELKLKRSDFEIELKKPTIATAVAVQEVVSVAQPVVTSIPALAQEVISDDCINSPMVGTYYGAPSPDASPFLKIGDTIRKGQSLCIIEAMKIMNEIEAEFDCKIVEILVNDSDPIEFDMPIFKIEKI